MTKHRLTITCCLVLLPGVLSHVLAGEAISPEDRAFFENKIRPVLVQHCYECHSAEAKELGGKLLLDSAKGMAAGGQSGPAFLAGNPAESLLIQSLHYDGLEMPPEKPLPETVISDFVKWVERGAPDPRSKEFAGGGEFDPKDESLWSFRPRTTPRLPKVDNPDWIRDPLDRFILAKLEKEGLSPAGDADARTLVRRLYFDLIGLPPSAEEIETFQAEYRGDFAVAKRLVDKLLASPHFGERWGRHWLDVARYGESNGDDGLGRNASFPHAWRYRDYVIDAFNQDVPYDRFLVEQIAGDLLPAESAQQRNRQLIATGFLAIGAKPAAAMNKNFAMDVVDDQINAVSKAAMGLSVSCARCHDHKHDPIPTRDYYALAGFFSSTETLYGLAANEKLTAPPTELHQLRSVLDDEVNGASRGAAPRFPTAYAKVIGDLKPHRYAPLNVAPEELTVEGVNFSKENFAQVKSAKIDGQLPGDATSYAVSFWFRNDTKNNTRPITAYLFSRAKLSDPNLAGDHLGIGGTHDKSRTGKLFVFNGKEQKVSIGGSTVIPPGTWNHVVLIREGNRIRIFLNGNPEPEIAGELPATFADAAEFRLASRSDNFAPLVGNVAQFAIFERPLNDDEAQQLHAASGQPRGARLLGLAMGVRDKPKPADCKIHIGGETAKLGPVAPRGFLSAYERVLSSSTETDASSQHELKLNAQESGRLQLAQWLTRADHPQTARVMVNRIWLHLFGRGIVTTPDDFGVYGARPTHPELLDHLAERFVQEGWSIKRMIRAIVLSRTYQLDSKCVPELLKADPDNRFYARHSRRRLDAEEIRDSMLQASGQLNVTPAVGSAVAKIDQLINWPPGEATNLHQASSHRSVYLCMLRNAPPPELAAFNLPRAVDVASQRDVTTLPTQALYLMNGPFVMRQAEALADLALQEADLDDSQRIRLIFRQALQRNPTEKERQLALDLINSTQSALASAKPDADDASLKAWASLCHALLATSEFRYVD